MTADAFARISLGGLWRTACAPYEQYTLFAETIRHSGSSKVSQQLRGLIGEHRDDGFARPPALIDIVWGEIDIKNTGGPCRLSLQHLDERFEPPRMSTWFDRD